MKLFLLISILLLLNPSAQSDYFSPSHSCSEPWDRNDQYEVENFKECIEDFVDEMQDQSSEHIEAANDAVSDWNSFANGW